jgi:hypothetical protein
VLEALTDRTVMEGEHLGELASKALDPNHRPTPRALGIAVGDEVEDALARSVALDPDQRPRDAGEFWGLLKHAFAADKASGNLAHAVAAPRSSPPSTLRMAETAPEAPATPVVEVARAGTSRASVGGQSFGGTLRMSDAYPGAKPRRQNGVVVSTPPRADESSDASVPGAWRAPRTAWARAPVVIAVVLAILVLGALAAAWLLAPRTRATARASSAGEVC